MDCRIQCVKEKQCTHFTHVEGNPSICYLKKGVIHKNNATKESNEYSSAIFHRHKTQNKRSTCRSKNYWYLISSKLFHNLNSLFYYFFL